MNVSIVHVQVETTVDWASLVQFGRDEYVRTFGHLYTEQQLCDYLEEYYCEELYREWVKQSDSCALFVAYEDAVVCGYCLCSVGCSLPLPDDLSEATDCGRAKHCGEIKRVYVSPQQCGKGLALRLLHHAQHWLKAQNVPNIFLGVYSENHPARRFYTKHGYQEVSRYPYPMISVEMLLMQYRP
jgi:ribosomal protein S18 acetylase RimI-like enzyme